MPTPPHTQASPWSDASRNDRASDPWTPEPEHGEAARQFRTSVFHLGSDLAAYRQFRDAVDRECDARERAMDGR